MESNKKQRTVSRKLLKMRASGETDSAAVAGKIWTIAHSLMESQSQISSKQYSQAKVSASTAASTARTLMDSDVFDAALLDKVIQAAGGYWTIANDAAKALSDTASQTTLQDSETVDQYALPHSRNWAYCGVATSIMLLRANGGSPPANLQQDMTELASEIYVTGSGSDVDLMAQALRERGLENATSTRTGNFEQLLDTLDSGQPVPFGVTHTKGQVIKLNSGGSTNYPHLQVGNQHEAQYPGSGHWVLVVGYEGSRENPTHFIYNDPAVGGQLRVTKDALGRMGVGKWANSTKSRNNTNRVH